MEHRFLRTEMVLGDRALDRLSRCHVAVFGLGGVGSYAAEILARSGVGELTLVDQDTLSLTNINRQLYALSSTVGNIRPKQPPGGAGTSTPASGSTPCAPPMTPPTGMRFSPGNSTISPTASTWSPASWT